MMPFVATSAIPAPEQAQNVSTINEGTEEDCQGAIRRLARQQHITIVPAIHQPRRVNAESTIGAQIISNEKATDATPTISDICLRGSPAVAKAAAIAPAMTPTGQAAQ
jgi:hypothetical protein